MWHRSLSIWNDVTVIRYHFIKFCAITYNRFRKIDVAVINNWFRRANAKPCEPIE